MFRERTSAQATPAPVERDERSMQLVEAALATVAVVGALLLAFVR